jgi:tRNA modification GTPase
MSHDTIVAIATAPGRGAVGIVRVSGPQAVRIMQAVCGRDLPARQAVHLPFLDEQGDPIDDGIAIFFPAPHSYTGEDVLELQGHGGPGVMRLVQARCLSALPEPVLRMARPGEFTQRAFLNDKLDLAQAEAVADLIEAGSERAARSALASLQGEFSRRVSALVAGLIDLRMRVEACLDFPEEDVELLAREDVATRLARLQRDLAGVREAAGRGAVLREGLRVVLVGAPNVGKSSLLNALAEEDVALVTDIAGTTRDRIAQEISIEGVPMHIVDTAGLRDTQDPVERLGIARTWQEIALAHVVIVLRDASGAIESDAAMEARVLAAASSRRAVLMVHNKVDLSAARSVDAGMRSAESEGSPDAFLEVSAKTGRGLDVLRSRLLSLAGWSGDASGGVFSARQRHLEALSRASHQLEEAGKELQDQRLELLAECLRLAQESLNEITGEFTADDLLGEIFGRFCIGK